MCMSWRTMEPITPWISSSAPIRERSERTQVSQDNWNNSRKWSSRRSRGSSRRDWREGREDSTSKRRRKRQKAFGEKVADWFRAFLAFLFSNVGIVCLVVGYTIAGAFIFETIEGSHNYKPGDFYNISFIRNDTAIQLWQLTTKENIFSEKLWKAKMDKILQEYQEVVISAIKNDWDGVDSMDNRKWSFAGAFLYSLTVITTIGYGNTCPRTIWGKVITIGYAIVGMPLFLLYLSNIGDILAKSFKWAYARCCLCRCRKRPRGHRDRRIAHLSLSNQQSQKNTWQMAKIQSGKDKLETMSKTTDSYEGNENNDGDDDNDDDDDDDDDDDGDGDGDDDEDDEDENGSDETYDSQHITVPLTLCLGIMVGYICGGALLFSKWEEWDFLDGSYFCFVSLSTIGFGDIVPGNKIYSGKGIELSFIFCSMYLMLGMALIAMCFNLMQEEVMAKIRSFTRTIKYIFRCNR